LTTWRDAGMNDGNIGDTTSARFDKTQYFASCTSYIECMQSRSNVFKSLLEINPQQK